jgi:hypothetical protein
MEQKMKTLALSFTLAALITSAAAQTFSLPPTHDILLPRTVPITDASGKAIGTATISGNREVIRDLKGDLVGTAVVNADGTRTFYDVNGRRVDRLVGLEYQ